MTRSGEWQVTSGESYNGSGSNSSLATFHSTLVIL